MKPELNIGELTEIRNEMVRLARLLDPAVLSDESYQPINLLTSLHTITMALVIVADNLLGLVESIKQ